MPKMHMHIMKSFHSQSDRNIAAAAGAGAEAGHLPSLLHSSPRWWPLLAEQVSSLVCVLCPLCQDTVCQIAIHNRLFS